MKYVVDRIEEDIIALENIETREITNIKISELDFKVREGNILSYENNKYTLDLNTEKLRKEKLRNRFNKLKKRDF
jgi:hypothetical protein